VAQGDKVAPISIDRRPYNDFSSHLTRGDVPMNHPYSKALMAIALVFLIFPTAGILTTGEGLRLPRFLFFCACGGGLVRRGGPDGALYVGEGPGFDPERIMGQRSGRRELALLLHGGGMVRVEA
jgi:hypothetical protein